MSRDVGDPGDPPPRHSPHPIPVIPIWRGFELFFFIPSNARDPYNLEECLRKTTATICFPIPGDARDLVDPGDVWPPCPYPRFYPISPKVTQCHPRFSLGEPSIFTFSPKLNPASPRLSLNIFGLARSQQLVARSYLSKTVCALERFFISSTFRFLFLLNFGLIFRPAYGPRNRYCLPRSPNLPITSSTDQSPSFPGKCPRAP
jgi:hypothetical protein